MFGLLSSSETWVYFSGEMGEAWVYLLYEFLDFPHHGKESDVRTQTINQPTLGGNYSSGVAGGALDHYPEKTQGTGGVQVQFYIVCLFFLIAGTYSVFYIRKLPQGHGKIVAFPLEVLSKG